MRLPSAVILILYFGFSNGIRYFGNLKDGKSAYEEENENDKITLPPRVVSYILQPKKAPLITAAPTIDPNLIENPPKNLKIVFLTSRLPTDFYDGGATVPGIIWDNLSYDDEDSVLPDSPNPVMKVDDRSTSVYKLFVIGAMTFVVIVILIFFAYRHYCATHASYTLPMLQPTIYFHKDGTTSTLMISDIVFKGTAGSRV